MRHLGNISWIFLLAALAGCQDETGVPQPEAQERPLGLLLRGTMPGSGPQTKTYVDEKGGFF